MEITFDMLCEYAKELGFKPRPIEENSKAKDITQTYYKMPWNGQNIMTLYEGEKRTLRGRDVPEVCWICINSSGDVMSIPSRTIRQMTTLRGFGLSNYAADKVETVLCGKQKELDIYDYFITNIYTKKEGK